jgi:hypothetical protein
MAVANVVRVDRTELIEPVDRGSARPSATPRCPTRHHGADTSRHIGGDTRDASYLETAAQRGPHRFLSGLAGVMSGVETNWTCAGRCGWRT